jgi:steroid delta-isomerase-like uncharacterized protein
VPADVLIEAATALQELDAQRLVSAYAEEALFEDVPEGRRITDRAELRSYFERLFSLPGIGFSDVRVFDGGSFAAIEWVWSGQRRDSGESFQARGVSLIELRDGKIVRESIYYDRLL